jgi:DNA (cytosine-5)-methyltransferase 1
MKENNAPQRKRSVELFAGCGGMALGLSAAGFSHDLLVEWNKDAAATVAANAALPGLSDWDYRCADVRSMGWAAWRGVDLVAGGPPCQPFSLGGKARGALDPRDMWPEAIRAVGEMMPPAFLFENVKGLLRQSFSDYVAWVAARLAAPGAAAPGADVAAELTALRAAPADYEVRVFSVDAADYGAAQRRHRVLFYGLRADVGAVPAAPPPTHSEERLLWDQWVDGSYWRRHGMSAPPTPPGVAARVSRLEAAGAAPAGLAWRTCRDAFVGLGDPDPSIPGHAPQPGARVYPGHTGSPLDMPAKALKAGGHGVPGGENMLVLPDGSVRYFTLREAARLQGFPDEYAFPRSWSESMRCLGNAVPTQLARAFGGAVVDALSAPARP